MKRPAIVSFVEDGWRSARAFTIDVVRAHENVEVVHYIRERVDPEVLRMITPYPRTRLVPIARPWFKIARWSLLLWGGITRRWRLVIVDNERAREALARRAARRHLPVLEAEERYQQLVYRWNDEAMDLAGALKKTRELF